MEILVTDNNSLTNTSEVLPGESIQNSGGITGSIILIYLTFLVMFVLNSAICLFAVVSSVINVITFSRMDLNQGVNQNLLILSVSDSMVITVTMLIVVLHVLLSVGYNDGGGLRLRVLMRVILYLVNYPLYVSLIVTTTIAVVRCCSIVMPLSFRRIFTARRQLVAILLCSVSVTAFLSYPVGTSITLIVHPRTNDSSFSDRLNRASNIFDSFRNTFFYTCLSIIAVSMVFLIIALRKSSQFQRQASTVNSKKQSSPSRTAATREAQVVKVVVLVLVVFVSCNVPLVLASILRISFPGFTFFGEHYLWYNLLDAVNGSAVGLNVALNFIVYYKYNSRFRQIVREMFGSEKV